MEAQYYHLPQSPRDDNWERREGSVIRIINHLMYREGKVEFQVFRDIDISWIYECNI